MSTLFPEGRGKRPQPRRVYFGATGSITCS
jgi:hypothetical protein